MANTVHQIALIKTYVSGVEEWSCAQCGRHFLLHWKPEYQCMILDPGEESAIHNTGKGAMVFYRPQMEDPWLAPWQNWFEHNNFESRWEE